MLFQSTIWSLLCSTSTAGLSHSLVLYRSQIIDDCSSPSASRKGKVRHLAHGTRFITKTSATNSTWLLASPIGSESASIMRDRATAHISGTESASRWRAASRGEQGAFTSSLCILSRCGGHVLLPACTGLPGLPRRLTKKSHDRILSQLANNVEDG